jgi:hypothetical protein
MFNCCKLHHERLEIMRRERALLMEQIRQSQEAVAESQELLRRFDEVLPKPEQEPWGPYTAAEQNGVLVRRATQSASRQFMV